MLNLAQKKTVNWNYNKTPFYKIIHWRNKCFHTLLVGVLIDQLLWKAFYQYLWNFIVHIFFDPGILLLGIYLTDVLTHAQNDTCSSSWHCNAKDGNNLRVHYYGTVHICGPLPQWNTLLREKEWGTAMCTDVEWSPRYTVQWKTWVLQSVYATSMWTIYAYSYINMKHLWENVIVSRERIWVVRDSGEEREFSPHSFVYLWEFVSCVFTIYSKNKNTHFKIVLE